MLGERGGGPLVEGFLAATGGGGGLPPGRGGGARGGITSWENRVDRKVMSENGLECGFEGAFRSCETRGLASWGGEVAVVNGDGRRGIALKAGGDLDPGDGGGLGADCRDVSGSDKYDESRSAPVSIPPLLFFNLGIPPASMPANCGASATQFVLDPTP